jgi:hypothetical protein
MITRANNGQDSGSILRDELDQTRQDLETAQREVEALGSALEDAQNTLEMRGRSIGVQDQELLYLRTAVLQAEDAIDAAHCETDRRTKDFQRAISRLEDTITDLQSALSSREATLQQALTTSEMSKTTSEDVKSRLNAYLVEIDRLSLKEAELGKVGKVIEDLRRKSADDEMKRTELQKRIEGLETDRELLNVALDSKQTELVLLQRATPTPTPRSTAKNGLTRSVSHLSTPTPVSRESGTTPMPTKRLSTSISTSDISNLRSNQSRRDSSIFSTPSNASTPRAKASAPILGDSTRHNRRESSVGGAAGGVRKPVVIQARRSTAGGAGGSVDVPSLGRKGSLPVLKGKSSVELSRMDLARRSIGGVEEQEELA